MVLSEDEKKEGKYIYPGERALLSTDLKMEIKGDFWGFITHRSSTEKRLRLRVIEGVIDRDYTGPIFVQVANDKSFVIHVRHGDRLAQMIMIPRVVANFSETDVMSETERGEKGFGSSGSLASLGGVSDGKSCS